MSATSTTGQREMLVCGKHEPVPALPGIKKGKSARPLRALIPGEKHEPCLCDYTEFPKLLQERLDFRAQEEKPPNTSKPFRLMDLPAELRMQIYERALCLPGGIEFCPEPWYFEGVAPPGRDRRAAFDRERQPIDEHHQSRHDSLSNAAKLLRTSKQVYREAKPVFYGENEWRFTNTSGWIGLDRFFFQIGIENCKLLRNITVCHPAFTILPETLLGASHFWGSFVGIKYPDVTGEQGIFYPRRWFDRGLPVDPFFVLEKIQQLRNLNIVLDMVPHELDAEIVDENKFDNLKVTLVSISDRDILVSGKSLAANLAAMHNADVLPGSKPWAVSEVTHDAVGGYEIIRMTEEEGHAEGDP